MSELYKYEVDDIVAMCINIEKKELEFNDYIARALICSIKNDNDTFYIIPTWRHALNTMNLDPCYCKLEETFEEGLIVKTEMNWEILKEIIELEVERCNRLYGASSFNHNYIKEVLSNLSEEIAAGIIEEKYKAAEKHDEETAK